MKISRILAIAIGLSLCLFGALSAAIINVPDDQPTIQAGIDAASYGDTVLVSPGTYAEGLLYPTHSVVVKSIGGYYNTFLEHPGGDFQLIQINDSDSGSTIEGFTISADQSQASILLNATGQTEHYYIRNNYFVDIPIYDVLRGDGNANLHAIGNIFNTPDLTGNIIVTTGPDCSFVNNTVDSGERGIAMYGENSLIINNIVVNLNWYSINGPHGTSVVDYNDFWSNGDNRDPGPNGISLDPVFVDPSINDYRLQITSPCIDAGDPAPQYYDPDDTRNDIGALYYDQGYSGPVWYVSISGNNETGDGSQEFPFATIQKGIDMANAGDTVLVSQGTYIGSGNHNLYFNGENITLLAESGPELTIIDCDRGTEFNSKGFFFVNGEDTTSKVIGFTITGGGYDTIGGGPGGGAIYINGSSPIFENCIMSGNLISCGPKTNLTNDKGYGYSGGAVFCENGSPIFRNCSFFSNAAWTSGGGMYCTGSSPTLENCSFEGNMGVHGIGGGLGCDSNSDLILINCNFISNENADGGGLACFGGTVTLDNCVFDHNKAMPFSIFGGGGAILYSGSSILLTNCSYFSNSSFSLGGALNLSADGIDIGNCAFINNITTFEASPDTLGIIHLSGSTINIDNSIISYNSATYPVICNGSSPLLSCCDIFGNEKGDYVDCIAGQYNVNGNISSDPRFCDTTSSELTIAANSLCAPENNSCGTLIGAFPVGCDDMTKTWHISTSGDDLTGDGSEPNPFLTIQKGMDAAANGDTVFIMNGTYIGPGNRDLVMYNKAISIIGEDGPDSNIIDVENSGFNGLKITADIEITDTFSIENLSIIGALNGILLENEWWIMPEALLVSDLAITQCSGWALKADLAMPINWKFNNCSFIDNESGIKIRAADFDSCLFQNNSSVAIEVIDNNEPINIANGEFIGNGIAFRKMYSPSSWFDAYISNSTFFDNETAIYGSAIATNCEFSEHSSAVIATGCCVRTEIVNSSIYNNNSDIATLGAMLLDEPSLFLKNCLIAGNNGGIRGYEGSSEHYVFHMDSCLYVENKNPITLTSWFCSASINNSAFIANDSGAIKITSQEPVHNITNCVFYENSGFAIEGMAQPDSTISYIISCNDFYDNEINFIGIPDQIGLNGNISSDPRFCDTTSDSLYIAANSPCAPENNSCSTLIGAFPVGCGDINRTYYVSVTGSDSTGVGTYEKPLATIQKAVDEASLGDTVMVMAGTYPEHIVINRGITLTSMDGSEATILHGTPGHRVITLDYARDTVRISGFSITGGNPDDDAAYGAYGGGLLSVYSRSIIENCEIYGNNAPDTGNGGGLSYRDWSYFKVLNCHIHDNLSNTDGGGVMISDPAGGVVSGNIIEDNQCNNNCGGLYIDAFEYWYRWIYVTNNTIVNNANESQGAGIQVRKVNGYLHNNIVAFNSPSDSLLYDGSYAVWASLCTLDVDCNVIYENKGNNDYNLIDVDLIEFTTVPGLNDIFLNPLFCWPDTGNYYIYSSSPCAPDNNDCGTLIGALDIDCFNVIPEIVSSPAVEIYEDSMLVYRLEYSDPDGPDTIITFYDHPLWLVPDADSIYGTPTEGIGDTSFMVMVSDGYNSDTLEVLIDVIPVNDPPVIIPPDPQIVYEGNHLEFVVYSSDVDNLTLYLSVENPPENSNFVDSGNGNGLFTFDPDIDQAGVYNVLFIVNDGELADSATAEITVYDSDPVIQQVIIDGQSDPTHVINNTPLIEWAYTDPLESKAQTQYEIAVGTDDNWTYAEIWNPAPVTSSDTFVVYNGSSLIDGTTYYLRLRVNNGEVWSEWYETSFHMNSVPSIPVVLWPIDEVVVNDNQPTLWVHNSTDGEPDDTLTYGFVVANDTTFGEPDPIWEDSIPQGTDSTGWQVTEPLNENWHYFWSARSFDQYEYSDWSETETFWVNAIEESPGDFETFYPPDTDAVIITDMLSLFWWGEADEPDPLDSVYYTLYISIDSDFNFVNTIDSIWTNLYTLTADDSLEFGTHYWWKVKATDNTGRSTYSTNIRDFSTWVLGDASGDWQVNILDATFLINYLYKGGTPPNPLIMGDVDGSCSINILDVTYLINYLYKSGPAPLVGCEW